MKLFSSKNLKPQHKFHRGIFYREPFLKPHDEWWFRQFIGLLVVSVLTLFTTGCDAFTAFDIFYRLHGFFFFLSSNLWIWCQKKIHFQLGYYQNERVQAGDGPHTLFCRCQTCVLKVVDVLIRDALRTHRPWWRFVDRDMWPCSVCWRCRRKTT